MNFDRRNRRDVTPEIVRELLPKARQETKKPKVKKPSRMREQKEKWCAGQE
jgi:hypothetical protein